MKTKFIIQKNRKQSGFILPFAILTIAVLTVIISAYMKGSLKNILQTQNATNNRDNFEKLVSIGDVVRPAIVNIVRVYLSLPANNLTITDDVIANQLDSLLANQGSLDPARTSVEVKCLYEGREDAHLDDHYIDRTPCTNLPVFPKVFAMKIRYRSDDYGIQELNEINKVSPERLLDYAYLITNETQPEVTIGAGEFDGQFGVLFQNPGANNLIRFTPDDHESLTFHKTFVTNKTADLSSSDFAFGFGPNQTNPPYGHVSLEHGIAHADSVPDIKESFENLKTHAITVSSDPGTPVSAKILIGGEGNDCKAEIQETRQQVSCIHAACSVTNVTETLHLTNNELEEGKTYYVRGNNVSVDSFNSSSTYASICANKVTFLTDGKIQVQKSILRKDSNGNAPSAAGDATAALVSLSNSIEINKNFTTLRGDQLKDIINAGTPVPATQVTAALEVSLIAPSVNQSALKINPQLIDPTRSTGLGRLETLGIIATGGMSPTKTYFNSGNSIAGFASVSMKYNQAIFDNPPPGLDESITGLPLGLTTDRTSYHRVNFEDALQALNKQ